VRPKFDILATARIESRERNSRKTSTFV